MNSGHPPQPENDQGTKSPLASAVADVDWPNLAPYGLTQTERLVIILYYYQELTLKELSQTLTLPECCVREILHSLERRFGNAFPMRQDNVST
jgi:hypothetical protein